MAAGAAVAAGMAMAARAVTGLSFRNPERRRERLTAAANRVQAQVPPPAALAPALVSTGAAQVEASLDRLNTRVSGIALGGIAALRTMAIRIPKSMDPRLQLAIANRRTGKPGLSLASVEADEVAVVARVTSPEEWESVSDVLPGATLGRVDEAHWIVTGRVPIDRAEAVRDDPCVISLKASQSLHPQLAATIAQMGVEPTQLPSGVSPSGGKDVVVGIVDFGCDFMHGNFRRAGKTRIEAIWHQAGIASTNSPFGYGRVYDSAAIDAALATDNPYLTLGYAPRPDSITQTGTHGTHVMDIAAGNGEGSGQSGVAPEATIIFVEADASDIHWDGTGAVHQAFGDSVHLLEAVRFIFDRAGTRPCVVNLSLGTNGGPHDGTSLVELGLDALVAEKPNRAVVIAASNSQAHGIHVSGSVTPDSDHDIVWQSVSGGGEFELWYSGDRSLQVTLIAPDGTEFGPVAAGENLPVGSGSSISLFISSRLDDPNNHDNVIGIWLAAGLSDGPFTIRLRCENSTATDYHAWIERRDGAQSSFAAPVPTHTLGSISTGRAALAVGSYDAHKPSFPLSSFSSSGPTRDGRQKPELSAPGHNVVAARSRTGTGVTRKSGTSMAAPAVSGLIALVYAEAQRQGRDLSIAELRDRLIGDALLDPPSGPAGRWDERYGSGRACAQSIVDRP
jgi:subtilisin family serine protease